MLWKNNNAANKVFLEKVLDKPKVLPILCNTDNMMNGVRIHPIQKQALESIGQSEYHT